ncbi:MAG: hypothetical protein ACTSQJ_06885 [Promethearchaeota archaeon]
MVIITIEGYINNLKKSANIIDPIHLNHQFCVFSTYSDDIIFKARTEKTPIFCAGKITEFSKNVYNFKKNEFVGYISCDFSSNIILSSNLIFKINEKKNIKLISIIPYASFALKLLRKINPKLGQNILLIGSNFFSVLLAKLIEISGAKIFMINLESNILNNKKIEISIYNGLNSLKDLLDDISFDLVLFETDLKSEIKKELLSRKINDNQIIKIKEISIYDKGLKDINYWNGIKYPYAYIRWYYKENIKYFINLVENKRINLEFLEPILIECNNLNEILIKIKETKDNALYLFKILN